MSDSTEWFSPHSCFFSLSRHVVRSSAPAAETTANPDDAGASGSSSGIAYRSFLSLTRIVLPSGDHCCIMYVGLSGPRGARSDPSLYITQSFWSLDSDRKAIRPPSGDQTGVPSQFPVVNCSEPDLSLLITRRENSGCVPGGAATT